jgi:hypothetical protein
MSLVRGLPPYNTRAVALFDYSPSFLSLTWNRILANLADSLIVEARAPTKQMHRIVQKQPQPECTYSTMQSPCP